jgi:hypothetical protein
VRGRPGAPTLAGAVHDGERGQPAERLSGKRDAVIRAEPDREPVGA